MTVPAAHTPAPPPAQVYDALEWQTAVLVRHFELLRRRTGAYDQLDRAEYLLLRTLEQAGRADINTMAATLGVDPSTAGRQIAAMQASGLVQRVPDQADRRRSIVTATAEGRRRMRRVQALRRDDLAGLLDGWSHEDLAMLAAMLRRYNRAVADRYLAHPDRVDPETADRPA